MVSSTWPPKRSATDAGADALAGGVDGRRGAGRATADDEHVERVLGVDALGRAASAAPVSSLATICSRVMRPWSNSSPFRKTVGTAITWRALDLVLEERRRRWRCGVMFGLSTLIRLSACTTSGQFWQDSEKKVSKCEVALEGLDCVDESRRRPSTGGRRPAAGRARAR